MSVVTLKKKDLTKIVIQHVSNRISYLALLCKWARHTLCWQLSICFL